VQESGGYVNKVGTANPNQTSPAIGKDSGPFIEVGDSQRVKKA
jgi:hypothetical protein